MTLLINVLIVIAMLALFITTDRQYRRDVKRLEDELDAAYKALGAMREEFRARSGHEAVR